MPTPLAVWLIEWLSGLKEIGKSKISRISTLIHLQLQALLDSFSVKFGSGMKALKPTEIWPSAMEEAYKALIS